MLAALRRPLRWPLARKLAFVLFAATAALTLVLTLALVRHERRVLDAELRQQGASLARNLARLSVDAVLEDDRWRLYQTVRDIARDELIGGSEPVVVYTVVTTREGEILAHSQPDRFPTGEPYASPVEADAGFAAGLQVRASRGTTPRLFEIDAPVLAEDRVIATAHVGVSTGHIEAVVASTRREIGLTGLLLAILASALGVAIAHRVTRPLAHLSRAVEALGTGRLDARVEVETRDEVGTIAAAFNRMAENLQALHEGLEHQVADRTAQLDQQNRELAEHLRELRATQEQLVQASKLAAVGTLIAGLSHEINNPITVVLGYAEVLLARTPDGPTRRAIAAIERQARRCGELVRSLLSFSRSKPSTRELLAPHALLQDVTALVATQAGQSDVTLEVAPESSELPGLIVCVQELESALINVVMNAVQVSPRGGVVRIAARALRRAGHDGVELTVADGGAGIPAEVVSRIFDPFFTTKPPGKGTGLGLSVARQIITSHAGCIEVETAPGEGTRMRIWLPLTDEPQGAANEAPT